MTGFPENEILLKLNLCRRKYYDWKKAYGLPWQLNENLPKDHHIKAWEVQKIIEFYKNHENDGYRRCAYMMMDQDIVYVSPSTVYAILKRNNVIRSKSSVPSKKGTGFVQPTKPHSHWHSDITNITIGENVYFLISILDGYSRLIVSWELRKKMKAKDVGIVFQKAKEAYPGVKPRCISDNGKQYKCKEFTKFLKTNNYSQVTTSPYYPQSNGKQERVQGTIKSECIRISCPVNYKDAIRILNEYIKYYNEKRLHSSIGYVAPVDKLAGKEQEIWRKRDEKLEQRRAERQQLKLIS